MPLEETRGLRGEGPRDPRLLLAPYPIVRLSLSEGRGDINLGVTLPVSGPASSKLQVEAEGPMDSMASCCAWAAKFWADLSCDLQHYDIYSPFVHDSCFIWCRRANKPGSRDHNVE